MSRRRRLSGIHVTMARHAAEQTAPAPLVPSRSVEQLSIAALDQAGASLLPDVETAFCIYCGCEDAVAAHDPYCSARCAINAQGDL